MKNLWIALLFLLTVSSCLPEKIGKKDDPEPDLSGTYQVTEVSDGSGFALKPPAISGSMRMIKSNDMYTLNLAVSGSYSLKIVDEIISLKQASGKAYDIYQDNIRYGNVDGTEFRLDLKATDGSPIIVVGRK